MEKHYPLGYVINWPEYQQYEEIPGFYKHARSVENSGFPQMVVEKEWLDKVLEDVGNKEQ